MTGVRLLVNGTAYGGWKAVTVTRSLEAIAGAFDLSVSDVWAEQAQRWPIAEEDDCRVEIGGVVVIDGYVGRRSASFSAHERTLGIAGKDKAAALVECSAVLDRWSFRQATVLDIARQVAEPFGVSVSLQAGLTLPPAVRKLAINPGDSPFAVIERAARSAGVLVVSDGAGGLLITRGSATRAAPIVEGQNLLSGSIDYSAEERYHRYIVATQIAGTDDASASATRIRAEATDEAVRRKDRVLMIRPDAGVTADYARQRADWEARVRAARAEPATLKVRGWQQPSGQLWPVNAVTAVQSPTLGIDGDMRISQVVYSIDDSGEITTLTMMRPDAFTPEPAAVVKGTGSAWKAQAGAP